MFYRRIIRPFLFRTDPEWIHNRALALLKFFSEKKIICDLLRRFFLISDPRLKVKIGQLELTNPVGLAAGFDKNVEAPLAYPMLGFGFTEFGSVTFRAQPGNPKPRLWRLPKDKGLIVYYGLVNNGAAKARKSLQEIKNKLDTPYGISIAPTTGVEMDMMTSDYANSFYELHRHADYIVLNVSCPNVAESEASAQVSFIKELLERVYKIRENKGIAKDVFVKIGPDMNESDLDKVIDLCLEYKVTGMIATNLVKDRAEIKSESSGEELNHPGGISGKILQEKSNQVIRHIYKRAGDKLKIIGVGGVFTAEDAYEKIRCGASAVQLITGFIYGGPFCVRNINKGLIGLLERDGIQSIEEVVSSKIS